MPLCHPHSNPFSSLSSFLKTFKALTYTVPRPFTVLRGSQVPQNKGTTSLSAGPGVIPPHTLFTAAIRWTPGFTNPPGSVRPPSLCTCRSLRLSPSPTRRPRPPHRPGHHGLGCGHVSRRPALGALVSGAVRAVRGRRMSVYLRRVPQGRRRHRTPWAERGRERRERRRDAGTTVTLPGLAQGTPGCVAEPQTRACVAGTDPPLGPSRSRHLEPDTTLQRPNRPKGSENDRRKEDAGSPAPTRCARAGTPHPDWSWVCNCGLSAKGLLGAAAKRVDTVQPERWFCSTLKQVDQQELRLWFP